MPLSGIDWRQVPYQVVRICDRAVSHFFVKRKIYARMQIVGDVDIMVDLCHIPFVVQSIVQTVSLVVRKGGIGLDVF